MELFPRQERHIRHLVQSLFLFGAITAAVSLLHKADTSLAAILIPALWGLGALLPGWNGQFPPPVLGFVRPLFQRGMKYFLLSSLVVFPLFAVVFYTAQHFDYWVPAGTASVGIPLLKVIVYNIAVVSFFEELFFRGYLYERFEEASRCLFEEDRLIFWVPVAATAFLFGAAHVAVDLDPARMSVFFPALLFGWLRAKTGSLIAPILSHATANVVFEVLVRSA